MKRLLNIKLISFIIILIFCLTPLSAIDLNQDNGTAIANDNNGTDLEIKNIDIANETKNTVIANDTKTAIKNEDIEIKNINESSKDIKTSEIKEDSELADPNLSIQVEDADYGKSTYITIRSNKSLEANVFVKSPTSGFGYMYYHMKDGYLHIKVPGNYQKVRGTHKYEVRFDGDKTFKSARAEAYCNVGGLEPNLKAEVNFITHDCVSARISGDKKLNNNVFVTFNNSGTVQRVKMNNGLGFASSEHLAPGNYSVNVEYPGNDTFYPQNLTVPFEVNA